MDNNLIRGKNIKIRRLQTQKELNRPFLSNMNLNSTESKGEPSAEIHKNKSKTKSASKSSLSINENRKEIFLSQTLKDKIKSCYKIIIKQKNEIATLISENKLSSASDNVESFNYYLSYLYNYLLLFCLLYQNNDIENARKTLNYMSSSQSIPSISIAEG